MADALTAVGTSLTSAVGSLTGQTGTIAGIAIPLGLVIFGVPLLVRFGKRLMR